MDWSLMVTSIALSAGISNFEALTFGSLTIYDQVRFWPFENFGLKGEAVVSNI
jgi:hypothetical protein